MFETRHLLIIILTISVTLQKNQQNKEIYNLEEYSVDYKYVAAATKDKNIYIIDVREPKELEETGTIPNSINIPLDDVENVLKNYSNEDFQKEFFRPKPKKYSKLIFSCRTGKRAAKALETALKLEYKNAKRYEGSWVDWEAYMFYGMFYEKLCNFLKKKKHL